MAKKAARRRSRGASTAEAPAASRKPKLSAVSTTELEREIVRRQNEVGKLERKRAKLLEQLEALDAEISAAGGSLSSLAGGGTRKRPKNSTNLADALAEVLTKNPLSVTEAAEAVQAAGYKSNAANFRIIVNQTLLKDKRFEKVSRGVYQTKASKK